METYKHIQKISWLVPYWYENKVYNSLCVKYVDILYSHRRKLTSDDWCWKSSVVILKTSAEHSEFRTQRACIFVFYIYLLMVLTT